ncbi:MAG: NTP transferase domain-containing protein [Candidatus Magasanikbacteria bacterium]|nr:NTP transferase domain-containing protein [Candidatus Magasanikbacteria bacterium]
MLTTIAIIPARMASSRFPGKPLKPIVGMPMVGHVYKRTKMSGVDAVYVATYDQAIKDYVESIGGQAVLLQEKFERPTECTAAALQEIERATGETIKNILMIQGDEPVIFPETVNDLAAAVSQRASGVVNIVNNIRDRQIFLDKNIVKAVLDQQGRIIWFFRLPSLFWQERIDELTSVKIQTGIIGFKREALLSYAMLKSTDFEKVNSVDMFRFVEHGIPVSALLSPQRLYSVDTPKDLELVSEIMSNDPLFQKYNQHDNRG